MGIIIVGGVLRKDNKYLLVQEAKEECFGKWNIPAGHLDTGETLFDGAKREIKEECGLDVNITGLALIGTMLMPNTSFISLAFSTEVVSDEISFNQEEILDVKWFTYDEIMNMHEELRGYDWVTGAINAVEKNKIVDLSLIKDIGNIKIRDY